MKIPIVPIIILAVTLISGGTALLFLKKNKAKDMDIENKKKETAQVFVNVEDIKDKFLYTRDEKIIIYVEVSPIDITLFSEREKRSKAKTLTAEFSSETKPYKLIAVSRPVDVSPLLVEYQNILSDTLDVKQKELLRHEMYSISNFALSGEVAERQFYFMLWEDYEEGIEVDILKRAMVFVSKFESAGLSASILTQNKIVRLCNLINNPAYANFEETTFDSTVPLLYRYSEGF